jgi:hypothetical protein
MVSKRKMTVDHKPKKKMAGVKGSISMSGPEKLLNASKGGRGAAKKTAGSRMKHKKTMY